MPVKLQAILPRGSAPLSPTRVQTGMNKWLRDFAFEFVREMQDYPQAQPWKHPPPRTGPRRGGRRTSVYGKGWSAAPRFTPDSVEIINNVQYAVWVGGRRRGRPGQARAMQARGWKSVSDVGPQVAKRLLPRLSRLVTS